MDVHPAGGMNQSSGPAQHANRLLQLPHLAVFQLGGIHLHFVEIRSGNQAPPFPVLRADAGILDKPPDFSVIVRHLPWVVGAGGTGMDGGSTEQGRYSFCGFLPCNPG